MANSFSTTYPEVFSKILLKTFDAASVLAPLVNRNYEGEIKNAGDTVNAVLFGSMTIDDYTPGTAMTPQNLSLTNSQMSIDQKKAFVAVIDLMEIKQSHLDLVKGWLARAGVAMAQEVDDRLLAHYADASATNLLGSDTAPITLSKDNVWDLFMDMARNLDANNIPRDGRVAVVDEVTANLIARSPMVVGRNSSMGDSAVKTGMVSHDFAGFDVFMSTRLDAVSNVKNLMFFTKDFISLAFQIPADHVETYKPELMFGTGIKGCALYGSKVFHATAGGVMKIAA